MEDDLEDLERALGGKLERSNNRTIPGKIHVAGVKVIYLRDDGKGPTAAQFRKVSRRVDPPHLQNGGAVEGGCLITTPDSMRFFCWDYHGDLDGWDKQLTQGAEELGVITAIIDGDVFRRSDGREFLLRDCLETHG